MQIVTAIALILFWLVATVAVVHVVMDNRQPAKTMAWALVIFFLPVVGLVLYLFFGVNHRRERIVSRRSLDQLSKHSMLEFVGQQNLRVPDSRKQLVELFVNQDFALPFKNNAIDILTDGYAFFPQLLADIASARHHIHIEMYIFESDALGSLVADALIDRARSGVKVRLVYDDVGCWNVKSRFFERMQSAGVEVLPFLPVRFPSFTYKLNYRNHRKLIVIDGRVGYIGGMNIALRYRSWRDTMLRLQGGIVYALQRAFLVDWYFVDSTLITDRTYYPSPHTPTTAHVNNCLAQIVTSGPTTPYPVIMQGFLQAITSARRYVYIETPYFLPNEPILFALKTAAAGGVDVCLLCPLHSDSHFTEWANRSYLRELHEAGARVRLYTPGFLHSKLMVVDDALATCGSTNVDFRSFENNFEANIFIYDAATALRLRQVFAGDLSNSVDYQDVAHFARPHFFQRLWESVNRLLSPLL